LIATGRSGSRTDNDSTMTAIAGTTALSNT
jgi:hypothetical protein